MSVNLEAANEIQAIVIQGEKNNQMGGKLVLTTQSTGNTNSTCFPPTSQFHCVDSVEVNSLV